MIAVPSQDAALNVLIEGNSKEALEEAQQVIEVLRLLIRVFKRLQYVFRDLFEL